MAVETIENAKIWDKIAVQSLIATNDKALSKALWNIFQRQTADEQSAEMTKLHNGRGFTGRDAPFLSSVAKKLPLYEYRMTPRQIAKIRPMMRKYWRQLLEDIEAKGGTVSYKVAKSLKGDTAIEREDDIADEPEREIAKPHFSDPAISDQPELWGAF